MISRLGCLAVAVVFINLACFPVREAPPDYLPPQFEMEVLVSYYPLEAYLKGIEGRVIMLARIEETGDVSDVRVVVSSGEGILDSAAQVIAGVLRFTPAEVHGQPQASWLKVPIVFTLDQVDKSSIDLRAWPRTAQDLQSAASAGEPEERRGAERELLDHYVQLALKMVGSLSVTANRIILEVAAIPVQDNWRDYQQVWPLPFVLFQDFLVRYPQSKYAGLAGVYFRDYLQYEASLLGKTPSIGLARREERQKLLNAMIQNLEKGYQRELLNQGIRRLVRSEVSLIVTDILGREVARLVDSLVEPGYHQTVWDGYNQAGRALPSGIYITCLVTLD